MTSDPLLLVPGILCTQRLYQSQLHSIDDRAVLVADHQSNESVEGIVTTILKQAPPQFNLAGLSMGGFLAMEIALRAPERVLRLGLLSTTARSDTTAQTDSRRERIVAAQNGGLADIIEEMVPLFLGPAAVKRQELVDCVYRMAEETGPEAYCRQQTALLSHRDLRPLLHQIQCPTLVLVGDEDIMTPLDRSVEIAQRISGDNPLVVENCGHLSTLEAPEIVNQALKKWLSTPQ
ncbi:MAG: alpha/beta fold hydrolase [Stappiaceae bacterium]